ncbi:hypothetical protein GCM10008013_32390 [Paenibacillus segetis]|uniref:Uncharacterized protein n=1 Tax=Paenibacillus segetis TaxID=1325360 RepID=A0ABQ1YKK9_9BACL|nr:hypothetical protein GCM10008013_32390 [Paenibacillus segetis]
MPGSMPNIRKFNLSPMSQLSEHMYSIYYSKDEAIRGKSLDTTSRNRHKSTWLVKNKKRRK